MLKISILTIILLATLGAVQSSILENHQLSTYSRHTSGNRVKILCTVDLPAEQSSDLKFVWLRKDASIVAGFPNTEVEKRDLVDNGPFVCEVSDRTGFKLRAGLSYDSPLKPAQMISNHQLSIKNTQQGPGLLLRSELSPPPVPGSQVSYTWRKDGQIISTGREYLIPALNQRHEGEYFCVVRVSGPQSYELEGKFLFRLKTRVDTVTTTHEITIRPDNVQVEVGGKISFHCTVSGVGQVDPKKIEWFFMDPETLSQSKVDASYIRVVGMSSIFEKTVMDEDFGSYMCRYKYNGKWQIANAKVDKVETRSEVSFEIETEDDMASTVEGCSANQRTCNDGQCIESGRFCDGVRDCRDGSDELNCESCDPIIRKCEYHMGKAPAQKTYNVNWECDAEDDCGNGFDEADCPNTCNRQSMMGNQNSTHFECSRDRTFIPRAFVCDKESDCKAGNEDESSCASPEITSRVDREYTAKVGSRMTFVCKAAGKPTPRIVWRFNWGCLRGQVQGDSQIRYLNYPGPSRFRVDNTIDNCGSSNPSVTSTLTIENVEHADQGYYNCEAISGSERAMSPNYDFKVIKY